MVLEGRRLAVALEVGPSGRMPLRPMSMVARSCPACPQVEGGHDWLALSRWLFCQSTESQQGFSAARWPCRGCLTDHHALVQERARRSTERDSRWSKDFSVDEEVDVESGLHEPPEYPAHQADGTLRWDAAVLHHACCTSSVL